MITPACSFGPFRNCNYSKHNIFISPVSVWPLETKAPVSWPLALLYSAPQKANIFSHCWAETESENLSGFFTPESDYLGLFLEASLPGPHEKRRRYHFHVLTTASGGSVTHSGLTHCWVCVRRGADVRWIDPRTPDVQATAKTRHSSARALLTQPGRCPGFKDTPGATTCETSTSPRMPQSSEGPHTVTAKY